MSLLNLAEDEAADDGEAETSEYDLPLEERGIKEFVDFHDDLEPGCENVNGYVKDCEQALTVLLNWAMEDWGEDRFNPDKVEGHPDGAIPHWAGIVKKGFKAFE